MLGVAQSLPSQCIHFEVLVVFLVDVRCNYCERMSENNKSRFYDIF